ncbi:MAG: hypothetical protein ABRQ24_00035 [Syntrophomonadaceae bacterium]
MSNIEIPKKGDCLYYTDGFISNPRTLSILTVLYDRVCTYFVPPDYYADDIEDAVEKLKKNNFSLTKKDRFTGSEVKLDESAHFHEQPASKHLIMSMEKFWKDNRLLRDSEVLIPIGRRIEPKEWTGPKSFLESEVGMNFYRSVDWAKAEGIIPPGKSYLDVGFFHLHRLLQSSTGLQFALTNGMVPFADHPVLASISSGLIKKDLPEIARIEQSIAAMLAQQTVCSMVPDLGRLTPEEIMEVRYKTRDERGPFTQAMVRLAYSVPPDCDFDDMQFELNKIIQTEIEPALLDLKNNIKAQKKELFRKISLEVAGGLAGIPLLVQQINASWESGLAAALGLTIKGLVDVHQYQSKVEENRARSTAYGLGFVLDLNKTSGKKDVWEVLPRGILPEFYSS